MMVGAMAVVTMRALYVGRAGKSLGISPPRARGGRMRSNFGIREKIFVMKKAQKTRIPAGWSEEARRLFHETVDQYGLDDAPSLTLLTNACLALMRLREAEAIVKQEGAIVRDRFGQLKIHPGAARCDSESLNVMRALRELGISLAPAADGSRPPEGI
jgi:phage terminase small subunit